MRTSTSATPVLLLLVLLAACGGSDGPTAPATNNGNGNTGGNNSSAPTVKTDPSFSSDIVPIFSRNGCTAGGCHGSPAQAGLNLASSPYAALVSVASTQTGEHRVIPGDAANSYLIKKLEGRASKGDRMPVGGQLSATDLTNLKNWINQGAKNN
jgi:hypothetical protein